MAKHTPSKNMVSAAKRGLKAVQDGKVQESDLPAISVKGARKLASGQQISDDHVRSMAAYHGSHFPQFSGSTLMSGGCPTDEDAEGVDDMLWGGPAGASWSAARVAAMDATSLAESESPDVAALLSDDGPFSMEIFSRAGMLDHFEMTKDAEGLIWAPIIRSGTLATRPGPNGTKKHEPLVFVSGHASDHSKEIGLADLKDAFEARAVEHVTIPKTHANDTLENTGQIVKLREAESTLRPGEKVLVAGHKFSDPDAERKVLQGSVLSRSCGILHNYVNTETGQTYPHVIEHVALTNKPWVTGMEPYGSDCFSDRPIVPMLLSEEIVVPAPEPNVTHRVISTATPEEKLERELDLADVQWGDEPSLTKIERQLYRVFLDMGRSPDYDEPSVYFSIMDVTSSKALVRVDYDDPDGDDDAWVIPFSLDDQGKLALSDFSQWQPVEQKWVTDEDADQDKQEVQAILQEATNMSEFHASDVVEMATYLSVPQAERDKAKAANNSLPDGSYPIENVKQLKSAAILAASKHGDWKSAQTLIRRRAKELGVDINTLSGFGGEKKPAGSKSDMSSDPLQRASTLRLSQEPQSNQHPGGTMGLTPDLLARLDLSDEAREVLQREIESEAKDKQELADLRKKNRIDGVNERISKLSEMDIFKGKQGFLRYMQQTLLSDDGQAAIRLDLADGQAPQVKTVTNVIDEMISLLSGSQDPSATQLAQTGSLLDNPLTRRPDLEPEKLDDKDKVKTGEELLAEWQKAAGGKLDLALAPTGGKE